MFFIYFFLACAGYCVHVSEVPTLDYLTVKERGSIVRYFNEKVNFDFGEEGSVDEQLSNRVSHMMRNILVKLNLDPFFADSKGMVFSTIDKGDRLPVLSVAIEARKGDLEVLRNYAYAVPCAQSLGEDIAKIIRKIATKTDVCSNVLRFVLYYVSGEFNCVPEGAIGTFYPPQIPSKRFPRLLQSQDFKRQKFKRLFGVNKLLEAFPKPLKSYFAQGLLYIYNL